MRPTSKEIVDDFIIKFSAAIIAGKRKPRITRKLLSRIKDKNEYNRLMDYCCDWSVRSRPQP